MIRAKRFIAWLARWPTAGFRDLGAPAAFVAAFGFWRADRPFSAIPVFILGLAAFTLGLRQRACERALAARLSSLPPNARPSLMKSLSRIAERLETLEQRALNLHPVTGLPTREHLVREIEADFAAGRWDRLIGAIRFSDYDQLAAFDHDGANAALKTFALRLVQAAKPSHVIGQIDRNCLCVWFRNSGDLEEARAEFRAIAYVAGQDIAAGDRLLSPSIEAGAIACDRAAADAAQLLLRVTAALSPSGLAATGGAARSEPPSIEAAREQFALEQDLARAIAENQLTMVFQPVVDAELARIVGAEALLRWDHPQLGPISPARFIPIVEAKGLTDRYGLWVLNAACREARRWRDEGLEGFKVAVNLSARQLVDPQLVAKIERTLQRHGLDAKALELELTETAAMADAERTFRLFGELRAMGMSLAIDDFGSGYSSLSYLKNLPFDKLKIDREFVTEIASRRDSQAICKALIELGRGLDLIVLAEGVETARDVATLRALGCRIFQGYYFSRPVSGDEFLRLAQDHAWVADLLASPDILSPVSQARLSA